MRCLRVCDANRPFNYLSKPLCSAVPVTIHCTVLGYVFDENLFDQTFDYIAEVEIGLSTAP